MSTCPCLQRAQCKPTSACLPPTHLHVSSRIPSTGALPLHCPECKLMISGRHPSSAAFFPLIARPVCMPASPTAADTLPLCPYWHPATFPFYLPHLSACQDPQLLLEPCPCQYASAGQPAPLHQPRTLPCLLRQICLLCAVPPRLRLATSALPAAAEGRLSGLH